MSWRPEMKFNIDSHSWCNYGCLCTAVARLLPLMTVVCTFYIFFFYPVRRLQSLACAVMIRGVSFLSASAGFRWLKRPLSETTKCSGVAERFIIFISPLSSLDWTIRSVICAAHCCLGGWCLLFSLMICPHRFSFHVSVALFFVLTHFKIKK